MTARATANPPPQQSRAVPAFTLIETMAAVVLMALLTGAVAMTLARPLQKARGADAADAVRSFDAAARRAAVGSGRPVRMVFDLSAGTLTRLDGADLQTVRARAALPPGFSLDTVRVSGRPGPSGRATVDVSSHGWTRSYDVHLTGPGTDRWLAFAGLTGQQTEVPHAPATNNSFTPGRHDAD